MYKLSLPWLGYFIGLFMKMHTVNNETFEGENICNFWGFLIKISLLISISKRCFYSYFSKTAKVGRVKDQSKMIKEVNFDYSTFMNN